MARKAVIVPPIPKYERLQRLAERYPSLDPTALEAHFTLLGVADQVSQAIAGNLARRGLSQGRFLVLVLLLEHYPRPLSHSELAVLSGVTKGNITGLVDGLQHDGYVRRESSGVDRRVTPISLTAEGLQHVETILPDHCARIAALMGELSVSERKTLVSLLEKVLAGLSVWTRE